MKRVVTSILLLLVVSFSYPILSQQRNVIINTNSVDRTVITTDPNVDIWTQLEQERIAAETIAVETIDTQSIQPMASVEEIHKEIALNYCYGGIVFKKYNNIYKSLNQRQTDTLDLQKIQFVVLAFFESQKTAYPTLEKEIKNAISMDEEIAIFLSYYKEQ